ncbi:MAG: acyl-CoA dehydrogenase family protein [Actinobacteria bacterium]|nr:acyl-CoA dehydrogenase family protein [Actinomycetota bacterium]
MECVDTSALRAAIVEFLDAERAAGVYEPRSDSWMRSFDRDFSRRLGERGWLGVTWPREYGGREQSHVARLTITEELLRGGAPVASHWIGERQIGPAILRYGSDALKAEFLPSIAAGELTFCLGMSESESGSDLAAVRTTATLDGEDFVVEGTKIWTTNAHHSQYAYVLACTDREADKGARLSEMIVDMDDPQVEVRPILDLAGEHHFNEVAFDGVRVPAGRVIGEVGNGWAQVTAQLAFERGGPERFLSTYPLLGALAEAVADDPRAAPAIGGLLARLRALRALAWSVAMLMDAGEAPIAQAAILKMMGTRFEQDVVEAARALVPGEPDPTDAGLLGMVAGAQLAMPGISLRGGATEILSGIVARTIKAG